EVALRVGQRLHRTAFASAMKRRTLSGSFLPGCASTPETTSTACGLTMSTARATLSGVSPPERITATRPASGAIAPIIRMLRHSIGSRVSPPSLHRALLSKRMALATLRHHSAVIRSPSLYSGSPSIVVAGDILTVLITGTERSAQSSGFSSPCSWIARSRHASMMAFTWPVGWSQKTPTGVTNGGSQRTIAAACSGVTKRGVFSTKMKPSASAPACTAIRASSTLVMPQILTRVIIEWVGRGAPPISPPIHGAPDAPSVSTPHSRQRQLADLRADIGGLHQSLADQHGMRASIDDPAHVVAGEESALAHDRRPRRDLRQQRQRRLDARLEGREITVVDADEACAGGQRDVQLSGGVALHQRAETEAFGRRREIRELRGLEDADDQQHGIGASRTRLPQLIVVEREILAQQRHVHGRAHRRQIVEAAPKIPGVRQDRDRVDAAA